MPVYPPISVMIPVCTTRKIELKKNPGLFSLFLLLWGYLAKAGTFDPSHDDTV
jgi:hypothetical protein